MEIKDYYLILGVSRTAPEEEIKQAWKIRASYFHPDLQNDPEKKALAEELSKAVNEAWEVLGNADTRAEYDQKYEAFLHDRAKWQRAQSQNNASSDNIFNDIFNALRINFGHLIPHEELTKFWQEQARAGQEQAKTSAFKTILDRTVYEAEAQEKLLRTQAAREEAVNEKMRIETGREWIKFHAPTYVFAGIFGAFGVILAAFFIPRLYSTGPNVIASNPEASNAPNVTPAPPQGSTNASSIAPSSPTNASNPSEASSAGKDPFPTHLPLIQDPPTDPDNYTWTNSSWAGFNGAEFRFRMYNPGTVDDFVDFLDTQTGKWHEIWPHPYPSKEFYRGLTIAYKRDGAIELQAPDMTPWQIRDSNPTVSIANFNEYNEITWSGTHRATFIFKRHVRNLSFDYISAEDLNTGKDYVIWPHPYPAKRSIGGVIFHYKSNSAVTLEGRRMIPWEVRPAGF